MIGRERVWQQATVALCNLAIWSWRDVTKEAGCDMDPAFILCKPWIQDIFCVS
jgi:hypothetical protein